MGSRFCMPRSLSPGRMNISIYMCTRCTLDAPRRNTTRASRLASTKAEHHCNRPGCMIIGIKHQEFAGPAGSNEHSPPSGNISYHILWASQLKPALVLWRYSKILGGTASGKFSIGGCQYIMHVSITTAHPALHLLFGALSPFPFFFSLFQGT